MLLAAKTLSQQCLVHYADKPNRNVGAGPFVKLLGPQHPRRTQQMVPQVDVKNQTGFGVTCQE